MSDEVSWSEMAGRLKELASSTETHSDEVLRALFQTSKRAITDTALLYTEGGMGQAAFESFVSSTLDFLFERSTK